MGLSFSQWFTPNALREGKRENEPDHPMGSQWRMAGGSLADTRGLVIPTSGVSTSCGGTDPRFRKFSGSALVGSACHDYTVGTGLVKI